MFLGTHAPRLDEKGRLILPAKYREELAGGVVITKGQERCLYVFPRQEFTRVTEGTAHRAGDGQVGQGSTAGSSSPALRTSCLTGRAGSPCRPALRAYAGLQRDCVVIGANTRLEIWDTQAWDTYLAAQEDSFAEAAEEVLPGIL